MTTYSDDPLGDDSRIPSVALSLGLGGLIPFLASGLLTVTQGMGFVEPVYATVSLVGYSAVILSFMAGARWGMAVKEHDTFAQTRVMVLSVIPAILAWLSIMLPLTQSIPLLLVMFFTIGIWDILAMKAGGGPIWYAKLRFILTTAVCVILGIVWLTLLF
ncbi:MAG: DUF3429 domain-containing protein [Pseudomonadota bacterium]